MKRLLARLIPDTIFLRLFLLLFVALSASHFIGMEVFSSLRPTRPVDPEHIRAHPFMVWGFLMRLAGITLTAWIGARWLAHPIDQMARAAKKLGESLEQAPLDETKGPAEIRQAAHVFNQMQAQIRQQIAERNRFLAAVSHDLRTPLTRLKLRAEKISDEDLKAATQADINEMTAMIDATLNYLRGDESPEKPCMLDVASLVHSIAENAEELGEIVTVSGSAAPILAQPMALHRCLNNLIENALRYGGRADITLNDAGDKLIISIRDAGKGIPEDQLEAVFAPFFRLDASRSRHTGGVGLGLSIARDVAKKCGGSLALGNAPGGGLVATLALPRLR
jgi:signal transduction histidine kinase